MTHHDDDRLVTWLADGPPHAPAAGLERALAATRTTGQRPAWLATALNGGAIGADRTAPTMQLISIVVALGLEERTVAAWCARAGHQGHAVQEPLVEQPCELGHVQAAEIRVKTQGGLVGMALAMMVKTRVWLAGEVIAPLLQPIGVDQARIIVRRILLDRAKKTRLVTH